MMHGTLVLNADGRVNLTAMDKMLREDGVNTFITRMAGDPAAIADDNNRLQALLEGVGLGIPMTVSTDPRNHFTHDPNATSIGAGAFSQWPETLGLAAIGDAALVQRFWRHRPSGVQGRRHSRGPLSPGGSRDRAALGPHQRHLR
ncbi:hypothetical protein ACF2JD_09150 [Aeromonas sp. A-5]|uniref:hypothetical protein n=1 Tax=Aeromonas ichthyocola TaxID=3367746 RepID=UPI0038D76692